MDPLNPSGVEPRRRQTRRCAVGMLVGIGALAALGATGGPSAAQFVNCSVTGTSGDDVLVGTVGPDVICGEGGNDAIRALGGDDEIYGGPGLDVIQPGAGRDHVEGGIGEDTIRYSDIASGGVDIDLTAETAGGPTVGTDTFIDIERAVGTNQADTLGGTVDSDWLTGLGGTDTIGGLAGNDVLQPGAASDVVTGGDGIDVVRYVDITNGGVTIDLTGQSAVGTGVGTGSVGNDTLATIERAFGTRFDDTLTGTPGNDDVLWGFDGADTLYGLDGADRLLPGRGDDPVVDGGANGDGESLNGTGDMVVYSDTDGGDDALVDLLLQSTAGPIGDDGLVDIEHVTGTRQDDTLLGTGLTNAMAGLGGDDTIDGRAGNDNIAPGTGRDLVDGGDGEDTINHFDLPTGATADLATGAAGTAAEPDAVTRFERVYGSFHDDVLAGDAGPNQLHGFSGDDDLRGAGGNDLLYGADGDDQLRTGAGDDTLEGGPNDTPDPGDQCDPGTGTDVVRGCEGNFNAGPVGVDDAGAGFATDADTPLDPAAVLANDTDADGGPSPLFVSAVGTTGTAGTVTINSGGTSVAYDPAGAFDALTAGQSDTDTFTYTVSDGVETDTATVTVTVNGVDDAPVAMDDSYSGVIGNTKAVKPPPVAIGDVGVQAFGDPAVVLAGDVALANDTDPEGQPLTATLGTFTSGAKVTLAPDGSFTYVPPLGLESTTDTFTYTVSDGTLTSAPATVTLTIGADVVWYVDAAAAAGGDGRSDAPLQTVSPLNPSGAADEFDDSDDYIVMMAGTYAGPLTLEAGQRLYGQPEGLTLGGTVVMTAGGARPNLRSVVLANGADIRSLDISSISGNAVTGTSVDDATIDAASAISATGGLEVVLDGGGGDITIGAGITSIGAGTIDVRNRTSGTVRFTGPIATGTGAGVSLSNNSTLVTVAFTGTLTLTTGSADAFSADNGGTVTVTATDNTIITTTGQAVALSNTTVGAAGVTFRSIDTGGVAGDAIALIGTGDGPFEVTGDGPSDPLNPTRGLTTDGVAGTIDPLSGGDIDGTTTEGVYAVDAGPVTLRNMSIRNGTLNGVRVEGSDHLTLDNVSVSGHPNRSGVRAEAALITILHARFTDNATDADLVGVPNVRLRGTSSTMSVQSSFFQGAGRDVLDVGSSSGPLLFTMDNTSVLDGGEDGLDLVALAGTGLTATVTDSELARNAGIAINIWSEPSSTHDVTVTGNAFDDNLRGVHLVHGSSDTGTFDVSDNGFLGQINAPIEVRREANAAFDGTGLFSGTIVNNTIGTSGTPGSGSAVTYGIYLGISGDGGSTQITVADNDVHQTAGVGVMVVAALTAGGHDLDLRLADNTVGEVGNFLEAIRVTTGLLSTDVPDLCLDITGNDASGNATGLRIGPSGDFNPRANGPIRLAGWDTAVSATAYLEGRNTLSATGGPPAIASGNLQSAASCTTP